MSFSSCSMITLARSGISTLTRKRPLASWMSAKTWESRFTEKEPAAAEDDVMRKEDKALFFLSLSLLFEVSMVSLVEPPDIQT